MFGTRSRKAIQKGESASGSRRRRQEQTAAVAVADVQALEGRVLLAATPAVLRIDAAASRPTTDADGNVWSADAGHAGGGANGGTFAVAGTTDDALYASRRTGNFTYANAVPSGDYTLNLLFAEHYAPGARVFHVSVENERVLTDFDIAAEAGTGNALVKSFPVTVTDGKLNLGFQSVVGNASVSAFELVAASSTPTPTPTPPPTPTPTPTPTTPPTLSIDDVSKVEGNSGTSKLTFTVTRTGDASRTSSVKWKTQNGTAGEGDYGVASGTLTFAAGQTSKALDITIKGDTKVEASEVFRVNLSSPAGATIADGQGQGTIVNDDGTGVPGTIADVRWSRNAPRSPIPRTEAGVVRLGSKLYAIGGYTASGQQGGRYFPLTRRVDVFDMATQTWTQLASLPSAAAGNHAGVATDGTYIYWIAGQIEDTYGAGTKTSWRYDIADNRWERFTDLPEIRYGGSSFILDGHLHYVAGDKADRATAVTTHWALDLSDPDADWERRASAPIAHDHAGSAVIDGKAYIFGGEHGHQGTDTSIPAGYHQHDHLFVYDPATDTWDRKADLPIPMSHHEGTTLVINGQVVLIGGVLEGNDPNITNRVHLYDVATDTWRLLPTRFPKPIEGATAGYWNGRIYMTDGYSPAESDRSVGFEGTLMLW